MKKTFIKTLIFMVVVSCLISSIGCGVDMSPVDAAIVGIIDDAIGLGKQTGQDQRYGKKNNF